MAHLHADRRINAVGLVGWERADRLIEPRLPLTGRAEPAGKQVVRTLPVGVRAARVAGDRAFEQLLALLVAPGLPERDAMRYQVPLDPERALGPRGVEQVARAPEG